MQNQTLKKVALRAKSRLVKRYTQDGSAQIRLIGGEDDELLCKVTTLLKDGDPYPFKLLMDDKIMKNLDEVGKERYLFETVDKFARLRDKIEKMQKDFGSENQNLNV